ncbi:T9SS type A sorting domain-containing protein [bacterium]|nr:T9SS type A sorting domain-containing protein [bacterium]
MRRLLRFGGFSSLLLIPLAVYAWANTNGPVPAFSSIAMSEDGTRQYVGLLDGGIWESNDAGQSWQPINELIHPDQSFKIGLTHKIVAFDQDADTVFAMMSFSPAQRWAWAFSTMNGEAWNPIFPVHDAGSLSHHLLVDRNNHNRLIATNAAFICISEDFGETWTNTLYDDHSQQKLSFIRHPVQDSTFYLSGLSLGSHREFGIYRSTDFNQTWSPLFDLDTLITHPGAAVESMTFLGNGDLVAVASHSYDEFPPLEYFACDSIFRSLDGGDSWTTADAGLPYNNLSEQIVEDPHADGTVLVRGSIYLNTGRGVYISNDYAETFSRNPNGLPSDMNVIAGISVNSYTETTYICSMDRGIWASDNSGNSWEEFNIGLPFGKMMHFQIITNGIVARGERDRMMYLYESETNDWQRISLLPESVDTLVYPLPVILEDQSKLISLCEKHVVESELTTVHPVVSYDNGSSWDEYGTSLTPGINHASMTLVPDLFETADRSIIALSRELESSWTTDVSIDSGQTWITTDGWAFVVSFAYGDDVLYALAPNGIFSSTDFGATWQDMDFPEIEQLQLWPIHGVADTTDQSFYVFASRSLWRHSEGIWDRTAGYIFQPSSVTLLPTSPSHILLSRRIGDPFDIREGMYLVSNQGDQWERLDTDQSELPYYDQFIKIRGLTYDQASEKVWVSTALGLMYMDVAQIVSVDDEVIPLHPQDHTLLQAYPNPFNSETRISITIGKTEKVKVRVYNIQGREMATLLDAVKTPGVYNLRLDASSWPTGSYFIKLETSSRVVTRKITLIK